MLSGAADRQHEHRSLPLGLRDDLRRRELGHRDPGVSPLTTNHESALGAALKAPPSRVRHRGRRNGYAGRPASSAMADASIAVSADEGRSVWWSRGSIITVKVGGDDGADTALAEQMCPPGYATPLHVHHEHDEIIRAREGGVDIYHGDRDDPTRTRAGPGDAVYFGAGTPHGFHNRMDRVVGIDIVFEPPLEQGFLDAGIPADVPAGTLPEAPRRVRESDQLGTVPAEYATEVLEPLLPGE